MDRQKNVVPCSRCGELMPCEPITAPEGEINICYRCDSEWEDWAESVAENTKDTHYLAGQLDPLYFVKGEEHHA